MLDYVKQMNTQDKRKVKLNQKGKTDEIKSGEESKINID